MEIIYSKRRTLSIEIHLDSTLIVRAPLKTPYRDISDFIEKKQAWIQRTQEKMKAKHTQLQPKQFLSGEHFYFLGQLYPLAINPSLKKPFEFTHQFEISPSIQPHAQNYFVHWYKTQAEEIIFPRVSHFAQLTQLSFNQIKISHARKRWGSCSANNNLSFSWRLIMAPLDSIDYVIIHELVHTIHKNHGKRFWRKVASLMPNYEAARAWLRKEGEFLSI